MSDASNPVPSRAATGYFLVSSIVFAAAGYAAQVLSGRVLGDADVVRLTSWTLKVGLWSVPAVTLQFYFSLARRHARLPTSLLLGFLAVMTAMLIALVATSSRVDADVMIGAAVMAQACLGYFVGRLQAEGRMTALGHVNHLYALGRVAAPFALGRTLVAWQLAFPLSTLVAALTAVGTFALRGGVPASSDDQLPMYSTRDNGARLVGSVVLTAAGITLPFLDFKLIEWSQIESTAGQFARANSIGRVLFFGGMILMQTVYPLQLKAARGDGSGALTQLLRHADLAVTGCLVLGGLILSLAAPTLVPLLFGRPLGVSVGAIAISCLNFSWLVLIYGSMQSAISKLSLRIPLMTVVWLVAGIFVLRKLSHGWSPMAVLLGASAVYGVPGVSALWMKIQRRDGVAATAPSSS